MTHAAAGTAGVLLAAGRGRRMGRLKQLLPWRGSTIAAAAFDALASHCGTMVVVLGDDRVAAALAGRTYAAVAGDPDAEQSDSARRGLHRVAGLPGVRHVLLHPADHPVIPAGVVETLLRRAGRCDRVLIPTHGGRGGHPVLIPLAVVPAILSSPPPAGGLRGFWESHPELVERIDFPGARELVMDLDTPEDYDDASGPRFP